MWYFVICVNLFIIAVVGYKVAIATLDKNLKPIGYVLGAILITVSFEILGIGISYLVRNNDYIIAIVGFATAIGYRVAYLIIPSQISIDLKQKYKVVETPLKVYKQLSKNSDILAELNIGDEFIINNESDWGEYYKIMLSSNQTGYISKLSKFEGKN